MKNDAGMTVLELLVVLAIGAVIATLVAASVPRSGDRPQSDDPASFLADARVEAAATGRPVRVAIAAGSMSYGDRSASWGSDVTVTLGTRAAGGYVVFHGDGTIVGPEIGIVTGGRRVTIAPDRKPSLPPS